MHTNIHMYIHTYLIGALRRPSAPAHGEDSRPSAGLMFDKSNC